MRYFRLASLSNTSTCTVSLNNCTCATGEVKVRKSTEFFSMSWDPGESSERLADFDYSRYVHLL